MKHQICLYEDGLACRVPERYCKFRQSCLLRVFWKEANTEKGPSPRRGLDIRALDRQHDKS